MKAHNAVTQHYQWYFSKYHNTMKRRSRNNPQRVYIDTSVYHPRKAQKKYNKLKCTKLLSKLLKQNNIKLATVFSGNHNLNPRTVISNTINFEVLLHNVPCHIMINEVKHATPDNRILIIENINTNDPYSSTYKNTISFRPGTKTWYYNLREEMTVLNNIDFDNLTEEQEFQLSTTQDNLELHKTIFKIGTELYKHKTITPNTIMAVLNGIK